MTILYCPDFRAHLRQQRFSISNILSVSPAISPGQNRGATNCRALRVRSRLGLIIAAFVASLVLAPFAWSAGTAHPAEQYVEGEVIVTFKPSANLAGAQRALKSHSLEFGKHFAYLSQQRNRHSGLVHATDRTTAQLITELSRDPDVEVVEPNYLRWVSSSVPNDALFSQLWGLQNTGQSVNGTAGTDGDDLKFVNAWSMAQTSSTPVVVAVVDTGVDYTHPDLASSMWTNPGETPANSVDDDGNGFVDDVYGYDFAGSSSNPTDSGYHGSHVAGTIAAAGNNLLGVIGVNYQAKIMALKASSDGSTLSSAAVIEAVQYATLMKNRGVNVVAINASFGGGGSNSTERAVIQAAGTAGIVFCAAAGNSSLDHDVTADYPASYRLANMIVVAASDQNDALASFSDYGATTVDLAAPGVNVLSTVPTVVTSYVAQASSTYSATELTFSGYTTGVTGTIYDCGLGYATNFPTAVRGNIALISRGTLYFSEKIANAMGAGARAAIIYNNTNGTLSATLQYASNWIPALTISQADGLTLKSLLPATGTAVNAVDSSQSYEILSGTSMATPHVSGAVAFAAMNFPAETVAQRIQRVLTNVDTVAGLQGKVITGGRLNLLRIVDTDRNGLPDWWEQTYFSRLLGTDASADADHDGASNLAEWLAGTNPTNAASCLRLLAPSVTTTNGIILRWPSVAGKTYRLERATNLLTGFNAVVRSNITATPSTNSEPDTAVLPSKARYYRILLEQ
jgi:subtilisin family serine protease